MGRSAYFPAPPAAIASLDWAMRIAAGCSWPSPAV